MSLNKINENLNSLKENVKNFDESISAHRNELLSKSRQTFNDRKLLSHLLMFEVYSKSLKQFINKVEKEWDDIENIRVNITEGR